MSENHDSRHQGQNADELLETHLDLLARSKVFPEVMKLRGYWSAKSRKRLQELGFHPRQGSEQDLIIPIFGVEGQVVTHLIRPDKPRSNKHGEKAKYELPKGRPLRIDVPPVCRTAVADPSKELWIADGPIQADAMASTGLTCIDVIGAHAWRHFRKSDKPVLADWQKIPLQGRTINTAFGSDVWVSAERRADIQQFTLFLQNRGARVIHALFPPGPNGERVAADDVLASGRDPKVFLADPLDKAFPYPFNNADEWGEADRFLFTPEGTFHVTYEEGEPVHVPLANFSAKIINELRVTDGVDEQIEFELEARLHEKRSLLTITAEEFDRMDWPLKCLGAEAIIRAGNYVRDELREAIQWFSGGVPRIPIFCHLGWVQHNSRWVYLHAEGAIGSDFGPADSPGDKNRSYHNLQQANPLDAVGPKTPIQGMDTSAQPVRVRVPPLFEKYRLPKPFQGTRLVEDILVTLRFLELGPDRIVMPLFAAIFRAAMDTVNFSIFILGPTGNFKSELALLIVQFFGPSLTIADLRGWNSTAAALANFAFQAKNTVFPVDDFVLAGSHSDALRAYKQADDLLRSQANRAGRHRARGDGSLREGKPPRCLLLCTGESLPRGQSLNARYLTIEIDEAEILDPENPIKMERIDSCQFSAQHGYYARTLAAFLESVAPDYERQVAFMHSRKKDFRDSFREEGIHPRSVDIAADLLAGFDMFLQFACYAGAIREQEGESLFQRCLAALQELLAQQRELLFSEDPVTRYLELLGSALRTGRAHLKFLDPDEKPSDAAGSPTLWGYTDKILFVERSSDPNHATGDAGTEVDEEPKRVPVPRGEQVGWKEYDNLYIDPETSLALVNRFARQLSVPEVTLTKTVLGKRLKDRGLLVHHDEDRNLLRRWIEGARQSVFHMKTYEFVEIHKPEEEYIRTLEEEEEERREEFQARQTAHERVLEERRAKAFELQQEQWRKLLGLEPIE